MTEHLLVEAHGPWAGPAGARFVEDAGALAAAGERVTLLLIQDGVTGAIAAAAAPLARAIREGVSACADRFSLEQRAVDPQTLLEHVRVVEIDLLARKLLRSDVRVVWH